jgi:sulfite reductase beta subunit-like hemoprotein
MGNPIHQAFSLSLNSMWSWQTRRDLIPDKLLKLLVLGTKSQMMPRSPVDQTAQRKIRAREKTNDLGIFFKKPFGKLLFTVVFEVGFSESYEDLLSDAKQWLIKSSEEVTIAVIIKIQEDKSARREARKTSESQERLRQLVDEFGNKEARLRDGIDSQSDVDSDKEMYDDIGSMINEDDWVGPLSAFLEIWELNGQTPKIREPRYVCAIYPLGFVFPCSNNHYRKFFLRHINVYTQLFLSLI